jgi:hypothetical protein
VGKNDELSAEEVGGSATQRDCIRQQFGYVVVIKCY